jgi:hypothetical protein
VAAAANRRQDACLPGDVMSELPDSSGFAA